jgi:hypothetical protein
MVIQKQRTNPVLKANEIREFKRMTSDSFMKNFQKPAFERLNPEE